MPARTLLCILDDRMENMGMNKWERIKQSFAYKVLIRWMLVAELISFAITFIFLLFDDEFAGKGIWDYFDLREEGIQKIKVLNCQEHRAKLVDAKTYTLSCQVTVDGEKYTFTADAFDIFGENSKKLAYQCAKKESELTGYLYSSHHREKFFFTRMYQNGNTFLYQKARYKLSVVWEIAGIWRFIIYILVLLCLLEVEKMEKSKRKPVKMQKKQYPADIMKLVRGLRFGEFRLPARREEAIGEFFFQEKYVNKNSDKNIINGIESNEKNLNEKKLTEKISNEENSREMIRGEEGSETLDPFVDPRAFGNRVMSDRTGMYIAQDIYRMHSQAEYDQAEGSEYEQAEKTEYEQEEIDDGQSEELEESIDPRTDKMYRKMLKGPIREGYYSAKEAILISIKKKPFKKISIVQVLELAKYGGYVEKNIKTEHVYAREMTGNSVLVVRDGNYYGIYEDVQNNRNNPIMREYEEKIKRIRVGRRECKALNWCHFFVSLILLGIVWYFTRNWMIFPEAISCLLAVRSYKAFIHQTDEDYSKKYGPIIYENMFHKQWGVPYCMLYVAWFMLIVLKCMMFQVL